MARSPQPRDFVQRILKLEAQVRRLLTVSKAHTETKTIIVPGSIDDTVDLPRVAVMLNADGKSTEWKQITGFAGECGSGSITVEWQLDGTPIGTFTALDTGWTTSMLTPPIDLEYVSASNGAHQLKAVIQSGSSATGGMSLAFIVATGRR